jgi:hypothetical protein
MTVFVAAVTGLAAVVHPALLEAFRTNVFLNGLILGVLLLGILYNFRQVWLIEPEIAWLERFRSGESGSPAPEPMPRPPRLLAPMATMLGDRKRRLTLSAPAMRSLLDGIASRLDESRDLSRYTIGLLVFLGLIGTFWGLMQTVGSVGTVIGSLTVGSGNLETVFENLKRGLAAPMAGMGTAFSSSLFGLAGSVILGFLDLQAGQAQNRFFNDLEDWLSGVTRLSSGTIGGNGEGSVPVYVQALLEQTAESLESLQQTMARGEDSRMATNAHLLALSEKIGALTDQMRTEQTLMIRLAEGQAELKPILARLAEGGPRAGAGFDEATRGHIRNLELYVARLIEELIAGREETVRQIRSDIKLLARTIAAAVEEPDR